MDNLKDTITNLTLYDVKAYVRKAQNVVMNYTEMEAKVREATNNEPWGASSTLMQEIANGTNSYSQFHEIMPMIYKRFTEKAAEEWRQIYKALQLLEFLIKNGSERVVDYARSHSAVIEMLKHFHFIDAAGKDQGINIRNRAKELHTLLSDIERIRTERKKSRSNKTKYGGIGSEDASGFGGSGKKYGGFGSESLEFGSGHTNKVFGDGGGFDGSNYDGPGYARDDDEFEEYQVGNDDDDYERPRASSSRRTNSSSAPAVPKKEKPKPAAPVADFISFDDDAPAAVSAPAGGDDDDFDDFQSATPSSTAAPAGKSTLNSAALADLFATPSPTIGTPSPAPTGFSSPSASFMSQPISSGSGFSGSGFSGSGFSGALPSPGISSAASTPAAKPAKSDAFGDLWSTASKKAPKPTNAPGKANLATLAQQSAQQSMWGTQGSQNSQQSSQSKSQGSGQVDDLLSF